MKLFTITAIIALILPVSAAVAQNVTTNESLQNAARSDAEDAVAALEAGDYALAATRLEQASKNATQLNIRKSFSLLASAAPVLNIEDINFDATGSSTLSFDNYIFSKNTGETSVTDSKGRTVTVRIFSEEDALNNFKAVANDAAMLEKESLDLVEMRGEQALKRRGNNGELSVLMMSEETHTLIEVEGDTEEAVMALIDELEN